MTDITSPENRRRLVRLGEEIGRILQADFQSIQLDAIKRNPKRHKLTLIMANGKRANWRYIPAGKNGRGSKVRFCYATNRNAAGYYLVWREVETAKQVKRDQWDATPSKKDAIETARRRANAYKNR